MDACITIEPAAAALAWAENAWEARNWGDLDEKFPEPAKVCHDSSEPHRLDAIVLTGFRLTGIPLPTG